MFLNLFILSLLAVVAAARLGGWQSADPKDVEVIKNVLFALNTRFPEVDPKDISPSSFKIIDVKKQVNISLCMHQKSLARLQLTSAAVIS